MIEDGWRDEIAAVVRASAEALTAEKQLRFLFSDFHVVQIGLQLRFVDSGAHVDARLQAVADLFTEIEHRRLVLLPLADHDHATHVDRSEARAHGVYGSLVRLLLHAPALQRRGG